MLTIRDPLPQRPRRILIAGVSGVGKTTTARRIAHLLDVPHTEIDALFHGPDWTPRESFVADVDDFTQHDAWVTEWQYSAARPLLASRAELMVWLDFSFLTVTLPRVVRRTLRRRFRREELWNGNLEPPLRSFFTEREHIVRWAWSTRNVYKERVPRLAAEYGELSVVRVRSPRELEHWIDTTLAPRASRDWLTP